MQISDKRVFKYVLTNGLTVVICPKKFAPKVSMQLWYNVGSKHEQAGEKGMAHFIEHMIFKGTHNLLSESDINLIAQKLSADINAFTSFDYTCYFFDVPVSNWTQVLPVFADCMQNVKFDEEHLNSEVKAVIQELKMFRDDFGSTLAEGLVTAIFESHPYHYPIIGYKQDLWNLKRETLVKFYKKYYVPNNATLVLVGDIDPQEALQQVKISFDAIARGAEIIHEQFIIEDELQAKAVTIYRDVEQPLSMFCYSLSKSSDKKSFFYDIIAYLLASGKGSRLHKILVDELQLATSVSPMTYDLVDRELFFIIVKPKQEKDIAKIKSIILEQLADLTNNEISELELRRALKLANVDQQHLLEDVHKQAYAIGKSLLSTGDETYPFTYCDYNKETLRQDIKKILQQYFRSSLCHEGKIIKVLDQDRAYFNQLQEESDALDTKILFGKERTSSVAPGKYVEDVCVEKFKKRTFAKPTTLKLSNGLKVLMQDNADVNLVECVLDYKANNNYDPQDLQGIGHIVSKLMLEGTEKYPGSLFIQEAESYGISFETAPGSISITMPSDEVEKGFELLFEMLQHAEFKADAVARLIEKTKAQLIQFWDTPKRCILAVAAEKIYKNHPYGRLSLGTNQSLENMTREKCFDFYQKNISAYGAILSIVGNLQKCSIEQIVQQKLGSWRAPIIADLEFPVIAPVQPETVSIFKNRDQVVLAFAGISVERKNPEYDALLLFDQLLTGGMSSRLFELREQSGLFYTIGGSVVYGAAQQPGMIFIKTIVSKDRLEEAQFAISNCLQTAIDGITEDELEQAKEVIINSFPLMFETYENAANTFIFLEKYNFSADYFEKRVDSIRALKLEDVKKIVKQYLNMNKILNVKIGRL
ncbi:insulinase family protein [Candidatus Babeliales bacterium]|nr:insulinase family protein [Candidatus Babeliales bacterium]